MEKEELRKIYKKKRLALSLTEVETRSESLAKYFFNEIHFQSLSNLHVFLPIKKQKEINTLHITNPILRDFPEVQLIVSKTDFKNKKMENFLWEKDTSFEINSWGIPEPINAQKFQNQNIDAILIPLLIFDKEGFRIGYGGGFYDRFLAECSPKTLKIGLSFFEAVERIENLDKFDIPLDICITNKQIWDFQL